MQNTTKNEESLLVHVNTNTVYRPVHKTEVADYGKVTGFIRGSYLIHADEYTIVFLNQIEKVGQYIQKGKL